jgi:hypothetical protein
VTGRRSSCYRYVLESDWLFVIRRNHRATLTCVPNKSEPFSLRLSPPLGALIEEEAKRTHRSKGAVVEALAEEALKTRLFPGIAFRGFDWERRAWVIGTALDVWEIVAAYADFDSVGAMAAETDLTERHIRLAVAYHERFPVEVDDLIARNRRSLEELRQEFPTIDVAPAAIP